MALRLSRFSLNNIRVFSLVRPMSSDSQQPGWGAGSGKGGGSGGTIRESGGAFGKMEAAHEEQYFRKLQKEQLDKLKKSVKESIDFHREQIEDHEQAEQLERLRLHHNEELRFHDQQIRAHEEAIKRHKEKVAELERLAKKD